MNEQEREELNEANKKAFVNRQDIEEMKRRMDKLEERIKELDENDKDIDNK